MNNYDDDLWDADYDDLDMIELAKKHDMVISSPDTLIIPKWSQSRHFYTPEQLKQFLRLYDTGVFVHLVQKDFEEDAPFGVSEILRITRASNQEEYKARTS